ncbi:MAG: two-component system sensor histidine kinase NtrB [Myxococcota bacterium]
MTQQRPRPMATRGEGDLRSKLRALIIFRVVVATFLMAATALLGAGLVGEVTAPGPSDTIIYGLVLAVYALSAGYAVGLRYATLPSRVRRQAYVQLGGDALFAAVLVFITGGTSSVFTFFFSLWIVIAAVMLYQPGAIFVATVSALLMLFIGLVEMGLLGLDEWMAAVQGRRLAPIEPLQDGVTGGYGSVTYNVVVNVVAFYLVAFLASYLADQLRQTDQRLRENQVDLEDLRALHEHIVSSIQSGLITVNRYRQITFVNHVAEEITGYRTNEVLYQDVTRFFSDLKAIFLNEDKLMSRHEELTCQVLGGELAYIKWTITPLVDARERHIGHILTFEDVTRVREMEEQMKRAEQFATLGKLAAAIAHEIRNPLASISGAIQLLRSTVDLERDDARLMDIVSRETDALNQWITDFLTYARPRIGERVPVDVSRHIADAMVVLKADEKLANIDFEFDADGEALVLADPTYLKQVIWNILNNAVQAIPDGGTIRVHVEPFDNDQGAFHRIRLSDTGTGIPEEALDRVFEPFFTTKESGTGLGLATVYRIVTEHGGHASVESEVGHGTTFIVDLPRHEPD